MKTDFNSDSHLGTPNSEPSCFERDIQSSEFRVQSSKFLRLCATVSCAIALSASAQEEPTGPLAAATPKARTAAELAAQTVVVFNQNDLDSTGLAGFYAEKRGISAENLIGLKCARGETISRDEYDRTIAEPLRRIFAERKWWKLLKEATEAGKVEQTQIRFVVLMRGIPLKIEQTEDYEGDVREGNPAAVFTRNEASVDSELSVLGLWSRRISGILSNPYFRDTNIITDTELVSQLLVCRLDAAKPATVERMIEDSLATEKTGLRGFTYIDARGFKSSGLKQGDDWLHEAARDAREHGLPVILDDGPEQFPQPYPMRHLALYLGWYSEDLAGPFAAPGFRLPRGAVAVHIHSFSAMSLRDPARWWCAPLLELGAAATLGNVYEPFLGLTAHLDVFEQRLREGFTFAEAAYMAQPYLSWMTTCIGDPLYRPYLHSAAAPPQPGNEWDAYRAGVATWLEKGRPSGEATLLDAAKRMNSGPIYESLGLLELSGNAAPAALAAFTQARAAYPDAADRIRVAVHESSAIRIVKGDAAAETFLRRQITAAGVHPATAVLRLLLPAPAKPAEPTTKKGKPTPQKTPARP